MPPTSMNAIVHTVLPGSIAEELGLLPGDRLLAVNDNTQLEDMLDYRFEIDTDTLELTIQHCDGSSEIYEIEKDPDEDLGLVFESPIFGPIKTCNNACPFCFIDQQPEGLRPTLYVKDDDYRLSYFNNTYITLTNLTARDRARIERLRPGPLYVSVHATDPKVRQVLLQNKKAPPILNELAWLKGLEIPFHCQVVLCPGINDGDGLTQTLTDLAALRPEAMSVAVVPVGLTQYRGDLPDLRAVSVADAKSVITCVENFNAQDKANEPFVFLSDEFYLKAGLPLPDYATYGDFPQLDDGVGTARMLLSAFFDLEKALPADVEFTTRHILLTGHLGAMVLQPIVRRLNEIENLFVDLQVVENAFWGQSVNVAGLITGSDILATLSKQDLSGYTAVILPAVMLKHDTDEFLDGMTVPTLSQTLGIEFRVVRDVYSADALVATVLSPKLPA